jgi:protoporphyrinogen oxidase
MPREEWNNMEADHPLEANLWQLPVEIQADFLESIAEAGCIRGEKIPKSFASWITWKLGQRIAQEYMLPYNHKIWSMDPAHTGFINFQMFHSVKPNELS